MTRTRFAVIGAGMAALPHGRALVALSDRIEVAGVFARTAGPRHEFSERFGFPPAETARALAEDPLVDALLLLTPPNARMEYVEMFAARGKHILCEKPLERSAAAAARIAGIGRAAGVTIGCVFQHRFRAASVALRARLAAGDFGSIRTVRAEVPWWRPQSYYDEPGRGTYARDGGGVLISQAIHSLDLILSLAGPVSRVSAVARTSAFHRMESEDFVTAGLEFASGAIGALFATTAAFPGDAESVRLDCDAAALTLKSGVLTIDWRDGRTETLGEPSTTGGGADPMDFPFDWHRDLIADFAEAITQGRPPLVTAEDAVRVQTLIDAIAEASATGTRTDVPTRNGENA